MGIHLIHHVISDDEDQLHGEDTQRIYCNRPLYYLFPRVFYPLRFHLYIYGLARSSLTLALLSLWSDPTILQVSCLNLN